MYGRFTQTPTTTVGELLAWAYANLAMAHVAVVDGDPAYGRKHYAIRTSYHKGLLLGKPFMRSLADDERLKLTLPLACTYCGSRDDLSVDHLISKKRGGPDQGENMVWACRPCNSSKGANDVLEWFGRKGTFPPLLLLRRYLKIAHQYCSEHGLLETPVEGAGPLPFDLASIPIRFPAPSGLRLWVTPADPKP